MVAEFGFKRNVIRWGLPVPGKTHLLIRCMPRFLKTEDFGPVWPTRLFTTSQSSYMTSIVYEPRYPQTLTRSCSVLIKLNSDDNTCVYIHFLNLLSKLVHGED